MLGTIDDHQRVVEVAPRTASPEPELVDVRPVGEAEVSRRHVGVGRLGVRGAPVTRAFELKGEDQVAATGREAPENAEDRQQAAAEKAREALPDRRGTQDR